MAAPSTGRVEQVIKVAVEEKKQARKQEKVAHGAKEEIEARLEV